MRYIFLFALLLCFGCATVIDREDSGVKFHSDSSKNQGVLINDNEFAVRVRCVKVWGDSETTEFIRTLESKKTYEFSLGNNFGMNYYAFYVYKAGNAEAIGFIRGR